MISPMPFATPLKAGSATMPLPGLEAQVQRAERLAAVGEMAAGLAHEVRNPLMSIRGFAQLLQEDNINRSQKEYLEIIVRETERMNALIEQLLYYARPVVNRVDNVDINAVVQNVKKLVESVVNYQERSLEIIDEMRTAATQNSEEIRRSVEEAKQRMAKLTQRASSVVAANA